MGFFDKIDNSTIVDTLEQLLNRRYGEIFSSDIPAGWDILLECASLLAEDHKIHTLAGRHQTISMNATQQLRYIINYRVSSA